MPVSVLFVCLGNICRSPMAEAVFQQMVDDAGLSEQIRVDSAGTGSWHTGEAPHRGTQRVLREHNIAYDGRARQVAVADFDTFDYLIAMDRSNLRNITDQIEAHGGTDAHVGLLLDFASGADVDEVPDPYYDGRFEYVYQLVTDAAEGLLAHIREQHNL
ncbi:MAG: low molecular weight phosphotyrosine protein phosphatase [Chloroflexi bacterium]|nr:low molecular weight phosphotyrosine protein phosphatase [Chloroflexota bacterium]